MGEAAQDDAETPPTPEPPPEGWLPKISSQLAQILDRLPPRNPDPREVRGD